jgi:hypothetical protein
MPAASGDESGRMDVMVVVMVVMVVVMVVVATVVTEVVAMAAAAVALTDPVLIKWVGPGTAPYNCLRSGTSGESQNRRDPTSPQRALQ